MVKKVLVIMDYVKRHYVGYNGGKVVNRFSRTGDGIYLKGMLNLALDTKKVSEKVKLETAFAYPMVPNLIKENKRDPELDIYQPPTLTQLKDNKGQLEGKIKDIDPDVILVAGSNAAKSLLGVSSLAQVRAKESFVTVGEKEYPVMATYSPAYVISNPNNKNLATLDFELVADFISRGKETFEKKEINYVTLTNQDTDKILAIIAKAKEIGNSPENAVAWDYETNSLSGVSDNSKIITVSISFRERTGFTFPIDHPQMPLSSQDKEKVVKALLDWYESPSYMVGHNLSFDLAQTKNIYKPIDFHNAIDTMVGFYLTVSQDNTVSKGLKNLAVQYTDMGEYDSDLDDYKSWFNLGFTGVRAKKLRDTYKKTFIQKVFMSNNGEYEITENDYLPFLSESDRSYALETAQHLLSVFKDPKLVRNEQENEKFDYSWIPYPILANYASGDTDATKRIHTRFLEAVSKNKEFFNLYVNHYPELINTTTNIQARGVTLDIVYLREIAEVFDKELDSLKIRMSKTKAVRDTVEYKQKLYEQALKEKDKPAKERDASIYKYYTTFKKGEELDFNPSSRLDLHYALFGDKSNWLPVDGGFITDAVKKKLNNHQIIEDDITFMDFKTDKEAIEELAKQNPDFEFATLYQEYGRLAKLRSTYTDSLIEKADNSGQIHGRYSVTGTATTRLSSNEPNMQNISKPTNNPNAFDYDYPIKRAFLPNHKKGQDTIVNLDFSSQEAHLAAVVADDENMIEAFMEGKDVHSETAALIYNVPVEEVTRDQRQAAKSVTFGLMYGKTPMGYAADKGITKEEAQEVFNKYFEGKPKIKKAIDAAQQEVERTGGIRIPASGFVRQLGEINSNQYSKQQQALRQAFNTVIQGSSAMLTQLALINIEKFLPLSGLNANIIMTVHDSITLSVENKDVPKAVKACKYIMEHISLPMLHINYNGKPILFPMAASADVGENYGYEFEYDEDDFTSFNSTHGFTEYYKQVKLLYDKEDAKIINEDELNRLLEELKQEKPKYQKV